jgi:hypothetical protein
MIPLSSQFLFHPARHDGLLFDCVKIRHSENVVDIPYRVTTITFYYEYVIGVLFGGGSPTHIYRWLHNLANWILQPEKEMK